MIKKLLDFLKLSFAKTPISKSIVEVKLENSLSELPNTATDVVSEKKKRGRKKKEESVS